MNQCPHCHARDPTHFRRLVGGWGWYCHGCEYCWHFVAPPLNRPAPAPSPPERPELLDPWLRAFPQIGDADATE